MLTTVYTSRGARAFHGDRNCRARWAGRDLNDWEVGDKGRLWVPGCRALNTYAIESMTVPDAMTTGKMPCLTCLPGYAEAWFQTPSEDDFGHEPWGPYDGAMICRRCYTTEIHEWVDACDAPRHQRVRVTVGWPCTSALVLGLVPRPGICPDCRRPMDAPAPFSTKCADCDHSDRIDALGAAL